MLGVQLFAVILQYPLRKELSFQLVSAFKLHKRSFCYTLQVSPNAVQHKDCVTSK